MSDTPRTSEEWQRLQRLPNGLYSPNVTTMDLAIGMNRFAEGLERECDGLRRAYDAALRQMNDAIAKAEWLRTDAIRDLERERDQARKLAGYYRDDDDNKRKREAAMAAAIRAGYCDHLRGPETHSS